MNFSIVQKFGVSTLRFGLVQSTSRSTFDGGTNYLHLCLWGSSKNSTLYKVLLEEYDKFLNSKLAAHHKNGCNGRGKRDCV